MTGLASSKPSMIGRTYTERGRPVIVLIRWGKGGGPRNVLIRREDGTRVVRPFRGLRKGAQPFANRSICEVVPGVTGDAGCPQAGGRL